MKLREWREQEGLSQQEVADLLGVDRSTVSKYETPGSRVPSLTIALKIKNITKGAVDIEGLVDECEE